MFDHGSRHTLAGANGDVPAGVEAAEVRAWTGVLAGELAAATEAEKLELIRALEELTCAAAGAQAQLAAELDASRRGSEAERGVPTAQRGRGVAHEIALARRESPHRGQRHLALATVLIREMPKTFAALRRGCITEWTATVLARETACLSRQDRHEVDERLAGDPRWLERQGVRDVEASAKRLAYALDPESFVARRRKAEADRHVSLAPAPDVMSHLSALLPVAQGVAVYAALSRRADSLRAGGDARSRGQLMADTLVERVTGQSTASAVPTAVNLVVSAESLLSGDTAPAHLDGYGPVPAVFARELAREADEEATAVVRRLFVDRPSGGLVGMEARTRTFGGRLATLIRLRDRHCRMPWCGAPIRHIDHMVPAEAGGPTSYDNGQGLCESCNHAKQARGWAWHPPDDESSRAVITTPSGHTHALDPPEWPGARGTPRLRADFVYAERAVVAA